MGKHKSRLLADCHLHFEGSLPRDFLARLAGRTDHALQDLAVFEERRRGVRDASGFLLLFAEVCRLFRRPEDYAEAANALGEALGEDGVAYAEIYVSPEIFTRIGLSPEACLAAVDAAFRTRPGGCDCRILLDVVRHWGPESAERVFSLHEQTRFASVVGFGMGGDETSLPAAEFSGVDARARSLGLKTSVHAGEWAGPDAITAALDALRPDRVDHGIAAAADPRPRAVGRRKRRSAWLSGNVATGAVAGLEAILCGGCSPRVRVALSADDPLLFATTTAGEYRVARGGSPRGLGAAPPGGKLLAHGLLLTTSARRGLAARGVADGKS
jgi:adenosine deaminase